MKATLKLEATMLIEINRSEIEILNHYLGYGVSAAKSLRCLSTEYAEEDIHRTIMNLVGQLQPVVNEIRKAEHKLRSPDLAVHKLKEE